MKRTPLKPGAGPGLVRRRDADLKRTTGRPADVPASSRRQRDPGLNVPANTLEVLRDRSGGRCESVVDHIAGTLLGEWERVCTDTATDVHHRQRRREGGHAITNLLHLCRPCHAWAHAHPAEARAAGLIVSVYGDPATVPVGVRFRLTGTRRLVILSPAGEYLG